MVRYMVAVAVCGVLAGCGDPLAGFDRLGDVDIAEQETTAAALPTEEEILRESYFGTAAAEGEGAVPESVETPKATGGLLGLFRRSDGAAERDVEADRVAAEVAQSESAAAPVGADLPAGQEVASAATVAQPEAPKGFLGRLLSRAPASEDSAVETEVQDATVASLTPAPTPARRGLLGRASASGNVTLGTGANATDVAPGTVLPFGDVARSCAAKGADLGKRVEKAPVRGYALYDTKPNTAEPRTFYITGFKDGCARQFTAANVLLGSAGLYERLHYGPGGENLPVGETDMAYEKVKRRVCGVGRRAPCGAQIKQMERSTFFVTAYSRFGNAKSWSELLIHDGEVLAQAIKSNK